MRPMFFLALYVAISSAVPALANEDRFPNAVAAREGANVLEPVSPWNIDYGENRCRLTRVYGATGDRHLLYFEQAAPSPSFGMTFAGSRVGRFLNARRIYIGMERDEEMQMRDRMRRGDIANVGPAVILTNYSIGRSGPESAQRGRLAFAGIDLAEAATADRIVVRRGGRVLSFETGNMRAPFEALNTCTAKMLSDWGLNPEKHQAYVPPRWTNETQIARRLQSQYPSDALRSGEQGIFRLRVIVEVDGSVSDCHLEESTQTDRLESPACREMSRAQFEPARDAQGNPMRSFYGTTITYAISG